MEQSKKQCDLTIYTLPECVGSRAVVNSLTKEDYKKILDHFNLKVVNLQSLSAKKRKAVNITTMVTDLHGVINKKST